MMVGQELKDSATRTNCSGCSRCRGVSVEIHLMEPALFVPEHGNTPAILRGSCVLRVTKEQTIRRIFVNLNGVSSIQRLDGKISPHLSRWSKVESRSTILL